MQKLNSLEEIISRKKARLFNQKIYLATENEKFKKDFDLVRQLEEHLFLYLLISLKALKEIQIFSCFAKASAGEVRSQIYLAFDLDYISEETMKNLLVDITEI
jgi:hypothetical protein